MSRVDVMSRAGPRRLVLIFSPFLLCCPLSQRELALTFRHAA